MNDPQSSHADLRDQLLHGYATVPAKFNPDDHSPPTVLPTEPKSIVIERDEEQGEGT